MPESLTVLATSPRLYPHALDLGRELVSLIAMDEISYRAASFLDERVLAPGTMTRWERTEDVARVMAASTCARPLHFIFHSGHVGSTLLSRLLDEVRGVLSLREPLPLRTLADAADDRLIETFLRLWERGFESTKSVVLKATSSAARVAPALLSRRPNADAVYLNLPPEPYLATLLAGANSEIDLNTHAAERLRRLRTVLGADTPSLLSMSPGELAAMSWLTERLTQQQLMDQFGVRILPLDFDQLLTSPTETMRTVVNHFAIDAPSIGDITNSPVLARYSKAPEYAYSPKLRADILSESRLRNGGEIRAGLHMLDALGAKSAAVASVLTTS